MVNDELIHLACSLIEIESVSKDENRAIIEFCERWATQAGLETERLAYADAQGVTKHNLVARAGSGTGGLAFFMHTDTVPGLDGWRPFQSQVLDDRIVGRGSCDMKGPIAAALCAAKAFGFARLQRPLYLVFSADEEVGHRGAERIAARSRILQEGKPAAGIVTEPTLMAPVYAHKGGAFLSVTAHGTAAHSSTELGDSSNFRIAPFMAEMARLKRIFLTDETFRNEEFDPPTNGFNMTVTDFDCASNVTAGRTRCALSVRHMPDAGFARAVHYIEQRAAAHQLETTKFEIGYFYGRKDGELMRLLCRLSGHDRAITVPYGTEASVYDALTELAVWGPGDIAQAHTVGEYIALAQLEAGQRQYQQLIQALCG